MRLLGRNTQRFFFLVVLFFALLNWWVAHRIHLYENEYLPPHTFPSQKKIEPDGTNFGGARLPLSHQARVDGETLDRVPAANKKPELPTRSERQQSSHGDQTLEDVSLKNISCRDYKGVLHIKMGDIGGAAGTIFFQFVLAQLIYAEQYHLLPWIHFDNVSNVIYDEKVHGSGPGVSVTFKGVGYAVDVVRPNGHWRDRIPGPPIFFNTSVYQTMHFGGNGVWNDYFLPVYPSLPLGDPSCRDLPYVTLTLKQITPGLHGFVSWVPKCWRYHYLPDYITKPHVPIREWLRPFRLLGHKAVKRYQLRFQSHIVKAASLANPHCSPNSPDRDAGCLGLHIRHSDKAAGRRQVPVAEFLPYARAFVHAGGRHIYLATDSNLVLKEIAETWPADIRSCIRSLGEGSDKNSVIRSDNEQAVFDLASHHRTNTEVLIEILALSWCRFMVHGLSAVSESSLWLHGEPLQIGSIDLEDPVSLKPAMFGTLVQMVIRKDVSDPNLLPQPPPSSKWWKLRQAGRANNPQAMVDGNCVDVKGILRISSTGGDQVSIGMAFFTNILNQIIYAEKHNWMPWIHLEPNDRDKSVLYDRWAHGHTTTTIHFKTGYSVVMDGSNYPDGPPVEISTSGENSQILTGTRIWESYMEPITRFQPEDKSCSALPMVTMNDRLVMSMTNKAPWAIRAWKYDAVPEHLSKAPGVSWKEWYAPIRQRAHSLVKKYYRILPYIRDHADAVNPNPSKHQVCLSVHIRNGDKQGKFRKRVSTRELLPYFEEFAAAGGAFIYVATDSQRALQFMEKNFPANITKLIRTQGDQVVRTNKEWPLHMIDNHHRVNSEALVDVLAMSRCHFLLHSFSTIAEAAIYLNLDLHNNSINLEDPDRMPLPEFGKRVKQLVGEATREQREETERVAQKLAKGPIVQHKLENATIEFRDVGRKCRRHALVYLAQKKHSSYAGKDSYASLLRSLDLVNKNYLSLNNHLDNLDIFIFHTNDFTQQDLESLESRYGSSFYGLIRLVNLSGSRFWQRPQHHANDDPNDWYAYPLFSEGYRRMMHWFAIDIWDFFSKWNGQSGCSYSYIFRLDEDSFIHSPIRYDIFEFMRSNRYVYGYRLCTYEMQVTKRMWTFYGKRTPDFRPKRNVDLEMCGFYNNFFIAELEFFLSPPVQQFLHFIDRQGQIYRRRLGDLMIHSMSVYAFADPDRIHRFLDFTYEHGTVNQTSGCLVWGGIQAGDNDDNATATISDYYQQNLLDKGCFANATLMYPKDLSPRYAHVPEERKDTLALYTVTCGRVEFPLGKGILSG